MSLNQIKKDIVILTAMRSALDSMAAGYSMVDQEPITDAMERIEQAITNLSDDLDDAERRDLLTARQVARIVKATGRGKATALAALKANGYVVAAAIKAAKAL